jgi:hypothetical protein
VVNFGQALRQARLDAGYSQKGLGRRVFPDISIDAAKFRIYRLEKGEDRPTQYDLEALKRYIKLNIDESNCEVRTVRRPMKRSSGSYPCRNCGDMFTPHCGRQKYCTVECRKQFWSRRQSNAAKIKADRKQNKIVKYEIPAEDDVLHGGHLLDMPPEKLDRALTDLLRGKRNYVKGHR